MRAILVTLISLSCYKFIVAQNDTAFYNGKPIFIHADSIEPGYTETEQNWPFKIYWYNINGEKFGKLCNYYDKAFTHKNYQSPVKYNPPLKHATNYEYFGKTTCYYPTGEKQAEYYVINHKREGKYTYYWRNGQVKTEGTYTADNPSGVWKEYSKKGVLKSTRKP